MRHVPAVALLVLALGAGLGLRPAAAAEPHPGRITVTGEARVEAVPDLATVTAGVQSEAPLASDALAANSAAMAAVFTAIGAAGIAPADFQTSQISLDPVWSDQSDGAAPRMTGYSASNLVTIRIRDVPKLGAVIDALGGAGANRIFGIAFELSEPRTQLDAARERAVADARAKARLMAKAAGVELGRVLSIREGGAAPGPQPMFRAEAASMDMPVAAGTVALDAQVEVVYAIRPEHRPDRKRDPKHRHGDKPKPPRP